MYPIQFTRLLRLAFFPDRRFHAEESEGWRRRPRLHLTGAEPKGSKEMRELCETALDVAATRSCPVSPWFRGSVLQAKRVIRCFCDNRWKKRYFDVTRGASQRLLCPKHLKRAPRVVILIEFMLGKFNYLLLKIDCDLFHVWSSFLPPPSGPTRALSWIEMLRYCDCSDL